MSFDVETWRCEFPILERRVYLNNNSLGAMPRRARDGLGEYLDLWAERGVEAWEIWFPLVREVSSLFARLIGADPDEVMVNSCVSDATSILLSCFDYTERDKLVCTDLNFPTLLELLDRQRRRGARLELIESEDGIGVAAGAYQPVLDERTLLLPISHAFYRSGYLQDAGEIARLAHEKGALVLLDAFQTVGSVPVDVRELEVDCLVAGSLKWLCGGPGCSFLYVRRDLLEELDPFVTGWLSKPRALEWLETGNPPAASILELPGEPTAAKLLTGTPAVPALYAARAGLEIILEVGMDRIRARQLDLQRRLQDGVQGLGFGLCSPADPKDRTGMLTIRVENGFEVTERLRREGFVVDHRYKAGIRVSPHFYNTESEVEHFVEALGRSTGRS